MARPPCEKVAAAFAGWLGPRISEAFGLKWQDLDLDVGVVTFRQACVQGRITPLKTEASRTNLPVPEDVLELLRQWRFATAEEEYTLLEACGQRQQRLIVAYFNREPAASSPRHN